MNLGMELAEGRWMPEGLIRFGIRRLNRRRLRQVASQARYGILEAKKEFIADLQQSPIALETNKANEQHYELPPDFFELVLGKHLKYSSGLWSPGTETLDQAEEQMLGLTCERATLADGASILELGCGWGSLSLWMARQYPNSRIVAVSNSPPQKVFIESRCIERGIDNLKVVTGDMNGYHPVGRFDRIISIEMFEHMRNWPLLLSRISSWLNQDGKLFIHHFSHRRFAYTFSIERGDDWMGRTFFTGGMMPSDDLIQLMQEQAELKIESHWQVSGLHYRRTAEEWLRNMDVNTDRILPIMQEVYGLKDGNRWLQRWRIFFMACSELWGYGNGGEWLVSHYLLGKP